jgi:hypothetical protein
MITTKLLISGLRDGWSRSSNGLERTFANSRPLRAALRTAVSDVCTVGNVIVLFIVGLAVAVGVAMVTSDPIETHAAAISDAPSLSPDPSASMVKDTKAAASTLATVGLSTEVGGLGHAELLPAGSPPVVGVPERDPNVPPSLELNGETALPATIDAPAAERVLDAPATTPLIE